MKLITIIETCAEPIVVYDKQGLTTYVNPAFERVLTELARSRQESLAANTAKAQFLSNISHEVRTPMNHVMGMIELLRNTRLDDEQQAFVDILQKSADSLMGVLTDVLDYSRIEAGKVDGECIGFDLRTLVEKIKTLPGANMAADMITAVAQTIETIGEEGGSWCG